MDSRKSDGFPANNIVLYYEVARHRLDSQWELNREYGIRVLQLAGIAASFLVVSGLILSARNAPLEIDAFFLAFGGVLVFCCEATVICGLLVLRPQDWGYGSLIEELAKHVHDKTADALTESAANSIKNAIVENKKMLDYRQRILKAALAFVFIESFAFVALAVIRYLPSPA